MRQAIEENFILDVLQNYTTYKTYYRLVKVIEDDPQVNKRKAARALARFMSLQPHNIAQKTDLMLEHFRSFTRHKIAGRAKAMVATDSRLHAVRYKLEFDRQIKEKKYTDIKTLVAFLGTVEDPDAPGKTYTEPDMNRDKSGRTIREKELADKFASEEYQLLIVAEKYQTGFDQPFLHTIYVDKRLDGVQAVQTLSRLNRGPKPAGKMGLEGSQIWQSLAHQKRAGSEGGAARRSCRRKSRRRSFARCGRASFLKRRLRLRESRPGRSSTGCPRGNGSPSRDTVDFLQLLKKRSR